MLKLSWLYVARRERYSCQHQRKESQGKWSKGARYGIFRTEVPRIRTLPWGCMGQSQRGPLVNSMWLLPQGH